MKRNIGFLDRAVRVVVGAGILSLLLVGPVPGWDWQAWPACYRYSSV